MPLVECSPERHAIPILEILNDAIVNTTALYDYEPRSRDSMTGWFAAKRAGEFPVIGLECDSGELLGFASYGPFRLWPAYKYSVEHSVYVNAKHRGKGVGQALLRAVIQRAVEQNYHVMVAGIDTTNAASVALHAKLGFEPAGVVKEVGFKFGRWLDLAFYQLILETPALPVDG
jgi:L-amino acid N-acyltransferase YncA